MNLILGSLFDTSESSCPILFSRLSEHWYCISWWVFGGYRSIRFVVMFNSFNAFGVFFKEEKGGRNGLRMQSGGMVRYLWPPFFVSGCCLSSAMFLCLYFVVFEALCSVLVSFRRILCSVLKCGS